MRIENHKDIDIIATRINLYLCVDPVWKLSQYSKKLDKMMEKETSSFESLNAGVSKAGFVT